MSLLIKYKLVPANGESSMIKMRVRDGCDVWITVYDREVADPYRIEKWKKLIRTAPTPSAGNALTIEEIEAIRAELHFMQESSEGKFDFISIKRYEDDTIVFSIENNNGGIQVSLPLVECVIAFTTLIAGIEQMTKTGEPQRLL